MDESTIEMLAAAVRELHKASLKKKMISDGHDPDYAEVAASARVAAIKMNWTPSSTEHGPSRTIGADGRLEELPKA